MPTPATPLSDTITDLLADSSEEAFAAFVRTFRRSTLGVVASALPPARRPGETFQAGSGDVRFVPVTTPDGRRMFKACADPETFALRFPEPRINALMSGDEILGMVAKMPDLEGVLVCSASSFHSVPITRADAERALSGQSTAKARWWKFWGR
jgi:hypothetical protein